MKPHDEPDASHLVGAVRQLLADHVLVSTDGYARYQVRVALTTLAIVERELANASADAFAHQRRLDALGVVDDAELAAAIRAGRFDERRDEVIEVLRAIVAAKLAVVNPGYGDAPDVKS
jgi:hypothetical protein